MLCHFSFALDVFKFAKVGVRGDQGLSYLEVNGASEREDLWKETDMQDLSISREEKNAEKEQDMEGQGEERERESLTIETEKEDLEANDKS